MADGIASARGILDVVAAFEDDHCIEKENSMERRTSIRRGMGVLVAC